MFLFKITCAYYTNAEYYYAHKSNSAFDQNRFSSAYNSYLLALEFNQKRKDEIAYYTQVYKNGAYYDFYDPENYVPPNMAGFANSSSPFILGAATPNVYVEGDSEVRSDASTLKFYGKNKGRKYIDIFNEGAGFFSYNIEATSSALILSSTSGVVSSEKRIWLSIDFSKINNPVTTLSLFITCGDYTKLIYVEIHNEEYNLDEYTYLEEDGYVSIEAEHYSNLVDNNFASWEKVTDLGRVSGDMMRAESVNLVGYTETSYENSAPYLEYNVYFTSTGNFEFELYRFPSLYSKGRVRLAISLNNNEPIIIEGANDAVSGNLSWEEGVFTGIVKDSVFMNVTKTGVSTIRVYMIDPFVAFDKLVVYTSDKLLSYYGPQESYNTTYNKYPYLDDEYESYYTDEYESPSNYDIAKEYADGYFVELDGKLSIEAESAYFNTEYANITNGRWVPVITDMGIAMRTADLHDNFDSKWTTSAPRMNYKIIITNPGTYNLWVNLNSTQPSSSVYAIGINNQYKFLQTTFNNAQTETFVWLKAGTQLTFSSVGIYEFNFYCSQDGMLIDSMYLTKTSETPNNNTFIQSPRVFSYGSVDSVKSDATLRRELKEVLTQNKYYYNLLTGDELGQYNDELYNEYIATLNDGYYSYLLSKEVLTTSILNNYYIDYINIFNEFKNSRNMEDNDNNYILYEQYNEYLSGLRPYNINIFDRTGASTMLIREYEGNKGLYLRAFKYQSIVEHIYAGYDLNPIFDSFVVEERISFNQADWGNAIYLYNGSNQVSIAIAFETFNNKHHIVAYNGNVKTIIQEFNLDHSYDIKLEVNVTNNTYNLYIDGVTKLLEAEFRNEASAITRIEFGSASANARMIINYLYLYKEK